MNLVKYVYLFLFAFALPFWSMAADYYWIGNTGNWEDISHWSITSGGTILHTQAPTANDRVFFDENSFTSANSIVRINSGNVFVRDMYWTNALFEPTLQVSAGITLNIFGSVELIEAMNWENAGNLYFLSEASDNTLNFGQHIAAYTVLFDGTGRWALRSPLLINNTLRFHKGELNTNGQPINCAYFHIETAAQKTLILDSSQIMITGATEGQFFEAIPVAIFQLENLLIEPGNSLLDFTASSVQIDYRGTGNLELNQVVLSNPNGNSILNTDELGAMVSYQVLDLQHSTTINGNNTIENLQLYPGKAYLFEGNTRQNINQIQAIGDCIQNISIGSANNGEPVIFASDNQNIQVEYVALRDIHTAGTSIFNLDNGIDLGNNNGWQIIPKKEGNLYWVGGSGEWNDPTHWASTSGGQGGACLPSAMDNVIFDAQSFNGTNQTVNLNVENAYCNSMDWTETTGRPSFIGTDNSGLHINGSLVFIEDMYQGFTGTVYFESNKAANTIIMAGQQFQQDLHFQGTGDWQLLDPLVVSGYLYLKFGTLNTNGQKIVLGNFFSDYETVRGLILDNSHITLETKDTRATVWDLNTTNLQFDAGTSTIESLDRSITFTTLGNTAIDYHRLIFNATCIMDNRIKSDQTIGIDKLHFKRFGEGIGKIAVDTLQLSAPYAYRFEAEYSTQIDHLIASGNCEGMIVLNSNEVGKIATLNIGNDHILEKLYLKDIQQIGTGQLVANNSADGGGVSGWTIEAGNSRTLYWVNATGNWNDAAHWSLESGGTGGECVPTPIDNVIFDQNSSADTAFSVATFEFDKLACHDFTLQDLPLNTDFKVGFVNVYGSITFQDGLASPLGFILFSKEDSETIQSNGGQIDFISLRGKSNFQLADPLHLMTYFTQWDGAFQSNGFMITAKGVDFKGNDNNINVNITNSHILLNGLPQVFTATWHFENSDNSIDLIADNSLIELTHPEAFLYTEGTPAYDQILFSNPSGKVKLESTNRSTIKDLTFLGNGSIEGIIQADTLRFSASKSYTLAANQTQKVEKYFHALGNNCQSIEIKSSLSGAASTLEIPATGEILADFIQMQDQAGIGGAAFRAGQHSTDIGNNNTGWVFESAPELADVSFLGKDRILCAGEAVTLNAAGTNPNENYRWQDNSTNPTFMATQPGVYSAQVIFENNCAINDSIALFDLVEIVQKLPADTSLCEGEQLSIAVNSDFKEINYLWQDGTQSANFLIDAAGTYTLTQTVDNCTFRDSITVDYNPFPLVAIETSQMSICTGESTSFAGIADENANVLWNTGATTTNLQATEGGQYWLEAELAGCVSRDSFLLEELPCNYFKAYLPTAFSPNNDGVNDLFLPQFEPAMEILSYQFKVFNRWGSQVFATQDPQLGWDGSFNGQVLERGIFIYFIEVEYMDDRGAGRELLRGDVGIVR